MDVLLIAVAFFFGLLAQQFGLPPLVGFLISGFVLKALGQRGGETLDTISSVGVTLMLFTIGLKLRLRGLLRPEVWAGTSLHIAGTVVTCTPPKHSNGTPTKASSPPSPNLMTK